jgi:hypothetical protein
VAKREDDLVGVNVLEGLVGDVLVHILELVEQLVDAAEHRLTELVVLLRLDLGGVGGGGESLAAPARPRQTPQQDRRRRDSDIEIERVSRPARADCVAAAALGEREPVRLARCD